MSTWKLRISSSTEEGVLKSLEEYLAGTSIRFEGTSYPKRVFNSVRELEYYRVTLKRGRYRLEEMV
jgi:hypothetical protein